MPTIAKRSVSNWPNLPFPVSNNAVASAESGDDRLVYSLLGIGSSKRYNAITSASYVLKVGSESWSAMPAVPGAGRLAATAQVVGGRIYLFGGYTVDDQKAEHTVPSLDIYSISTSTWSQGADIPVPVDDSVSGVYQDRYIYLISGWSESDNVDRVQVYDTETDSWKQATATLGRPVFGHAGCIIGNQIVYCNGVIRSAKSFAANSECWLGSIDSADRTLITWTQLPDHPGTSRYRIASGVDSSRGKIWFVGGTDNPYNYDGIGYDGTPAEPSAEVFAWDLTSGDWQTFYNKGNASMDHRGLILTKNAIFTVGGMELRQRVTDHVQGHDIA